MPFHSDSGLPLTKIFPKERQALFNFGWKQRVRKIPMTTNIFFGPLDTWLSPVGLKGISRVMPKRKS